MVYRQPVWRAGVASNAGVRPEDSWKMPSNVMGGPGCSGEWPEGHWEDELIEAAEDAPRPRPRRPPRPRCVKKKSAAPAALFDGLY